MEAITFHVREGSIGHSAGPTFHSHLVVPPIRARESFEAPTRETDRPSLRIAVATSKALIVFFENILYTFLLCNYFISVEQISV